MEYGYREHRLHGTQQFPCAYYNAASCSREGGFEVKYHWHEEIEIMFLQKGDFLVEINMVQYELSAPCICVINSGELHALQTVSEEYTENAIVFHPRLLAFQEADQMQEQIIDVLIENCLQLPRIIRPSDTIWNVVFHEYICMEQAFLRDSKRIEQDQLLADTAVSQLVVKASLLKILASFQTAALLQVRPVREDIRVFYVKAALSYIHEHYKEKIYIRDLASQAGLNEQYFCRLFRKVIRMSPVEYMNSYRMKKAIALLEQSELSVTEVAYECGFHDMGGFIREFKKMTETTPLQYRKKFRLHS
ncbi:MAG: helix-turn-helix domain-containing protein [Lachnospiraceae bacterium]|nr:helix-turn-helix domain-containing protein [Lachnospiraceae bacterium]